MPYRMKHRPTGLYFTPSRDVRAPGWVSGYVKSNLSPNGKIYPKKPSFAWIGDNFYSHLAVAPPPASNAFSRAKSVLLPFIETEWIIETI